MPTYDYECVKGHRLELYQAMTARPKAKCPKCGAKTNRLIGGGSGIIFRGTGFYETDYKRKSAGTSGAGKTEAKPSEAKPSETKSPKSFSPKSDVGHDKPT
ncbi:MAG: zinc ribbon domain-containing protein [Candidatus Omnitrophica bacterium]|nr:zinc ribbon domain-containing protein [Candidatus Omnitrophota bacterium]